MQLQNNPSIPMRFSTFVIKNIVRRRVRSALTVIGVAVAVGAVVALVGISSGFVQSFLEIYKKKNVDLIVQQAGEKQKLLSALPESLGDRIAALPGVKTVYAGLLDHIQMDELEPVGLLIQGVPVNSPLFNTWQITAGRKLQEGDTNQVVIGKKLAATLNKGVGDTITVLDDQVFEVVGIYEAGSIYEDGMMILSLERLQKFMGRKGLVTGFSINLEDRSQEGVERVAKEIAGLAKNLDIKTTRELVNSTNEIQFIKAMAWITSTVALFIGSIGMLNTMIMSVFERTKEIGVLRAIGWGRWRVVKMILMESVILSLLGGAVGAAGAMLLAKVLSKFPAAAGVIEGNLAPSVILQGFLIALGVGLLGAAYPAYRGAQLLPTEALRHE
jgi:putative ABC transport system permease protein